jgi:phospholipid/cholesterol/gamma-HCH transport system permease protein
MNVFFYLGKYLLLVKSLFARPEKISMYWKEMIRQMNDIGVGSLGIIAIISLFIGAVTAIQFSYQLSGNLVPLWWIGIIVRDSMILELAPTISGLILAGKVGSSIATELGTMRISEQIDALEIMGVNTKAYLVGPKVLGALIIIPLLVILAASLGMLGGLFAGTLTGIYSQSEYIRGLQDYFNDFDLYVMILKSLVFSFLITTISSYHGYFANGGALEIGRASTRAVVQSSIAIIVANFIIASIVL